MRFVHFDSVLSHTPEFLEKAFGYSPGVINKPDIHESLKHYYDRFEKTFLSKIIPGETYIFIIVTPFDQKENPHSNYQYSHWLRHVKEFGMEPYRVFGSPKVFMNHNVDKSVPRLMLHAFRFDEKYVEFTKGFIK